MYYQVSNTLDRGNTVPSRCEFTPGDMVGEYVVEKMLGEGTFGVVYKVSNASGVPYAMKLLKLWTVTSDLCKDLEDRFVMEFETGKIESKYLVHSKEYGVVCGNPFIIMEFCNGGDLRSLMKNGGYDVFTVALQILMGLRDLHSCGKVHRDLKPENVLIKNDNTAVLTDFGISGDRNHRMTRRNWRGVPLQIFGTYAYIPPEQLKPTREKFITVLPTSDLFSFGVMLFEMLTGNLPFGELTESTVGRYCDRGEKGEWDRTFMNGVNHSEILLPIIESCLIPNPHKRVQTADQLIEKLKLYAKDTSINVNEMSVHNSIYNVRSGVLLRVMQGGEFGMKYYLNNLIHNKRFITLGRMNDTINNAIPLMEIGTKFISRRHCTFECNEDGTQWYIRDGQWHSDTGIWELSTNGTFVNSTQINDSGTELHPGDIITIGDVKLRVEGY